MENKEHLASMVKNLVHDRNEEASVDFHNYLQAKMRELVNPATESKVDDDDVDETNESNEETDED